MQSPVSYDHSQPETALEARVDPAAGEWLRLGVQAALDGKREDARYYFVQSVRTDLNFGRAWLYLGGVAEDPALTLSCTQKVLSLDPAETQARTGLLWARNKLGLVQPLLPVWGPAPALPTAPDRATTPLAPEQVAALPAPEPAAASSAPAAPVIESATVAEDDVGARFVKRGVSAAADGNRARARYYFLKAIAADSGNTRAWLYFGGVADDASTTLACMERVLRLEPRNRDAQAGAEWAVRKMGVTAPAMSWWK